MSYINDRETDRAQRSTSITATQSCLRTKWEVLESNIKFQTAQKRETSGGAREGKAPRQG